MSKALTIAMQTGVPAKTIRYYEETGLIPVGWISPSKLKNGLLSSRKTSLNSLRTTAFLSVP